MEIEVGEDTALRELLGGLEPECTIEGHDVYIQSHGGPAKFIMHLTCPDCGYHEAEAMCAPMAALVRQAEEKGMVHWMEECCGATFRYDEMISWEAL